MVFSDLFFIYIFLPLCLLLYFIGENINYRNAVLIIFSLVFYAWGEPVCLCLLLLTAVTDYLNGRFIERHRGKKSAKWGIVCSLVVNLGLLAVFKYSGFLVSNINALLGLTIPVPEIALPVGISFYSFQSISYVVDVYRGEVKAQKNFFKYLLYISLFFQLVAGPIVRYKTVAEEIDRRRVSINEFSEGLTRFMVGLGKKVIIANNVGGIATSFLTFDDKPTSVFAAWAGVIMFSLQIYFDFSGYSDMAIGLGRMCGFHFNENFNYPYVSRSATEFWRRWHISMGSFFRDYVYIPLGGNRKHKLLNLLIVWFLTGLWHGASWNFILWGLYFGLFIVLEKFVYGKWLDKIPHIFSHIYLLFIVIIGWALFYFTDLGKLGKCLAAMFGFSGIPASDLISQNMLSQNLFIIIAAFIFCMPVVKIGERIVKKCDPERPYLLAAIYSARTVFCLAILALSSLMLLGQTYNPFLYYRF